MSRALLLKIVNALLVLSFLVQVASVVVMEISPGEFIGELHEVNGYILIGLVVLHVILNFAWIKTNLLTWRKRSA